MKKHRTSPGIPRTPRTASPSAVTDGVHVIASFESRGIYAYDMAGRLVWQKDLGDKRMRRIPFGEGSTPALHGDTLVTVWDHQGQSFIAALDKRTGEEKWRQNRTEIDTWATPLVVEVGGKAQVITGAMNKITSYDLATGAVVWHTAGLTMNAIPSPVFENGTAILMSGFRGNSLKANQAGGRQGRHHGNAGDSVDARSRHAVRAVAPALRRHSVFPQVEQRHPVGVRRGDRAAALSASAA